MFVICFSCNAKDGCWYEQGLAVKVLMSRMLWTLLNHRQKVTPAGRWTGSCYTKCTRSSPSFGSFSHTWLLPAPELRDRAQSVKSIWCIVVWSVPDTVRRARLFGGVTKQFLSDPLSLSLTCSSSVSSLVACRITSPSWSCALSLFPHFRWTQSRFLQCYWVVPLCLLVPVVKKFVVINTQTPHNYLNKAQKCQTAWVAPRRKVLMAVCLFCVSDALPPWTEALRAYGEKAALLGALPLLLGLCKPWREGERSNNCLVIWVE